MERIVLSQVDDKAKIFNPTVYLYIEGDITDGHYYWSYFNSIVSCLAFSRFSTSYLLCFKI